jgi:hypothetical protein
MALRFVSSYGTLLARSAFVVWSVFVPVNRNIRSLSALTRPSLARFIYRHPCIIAAQTPHSCCTISPTRSHSKTFGDGSKVSLLTGRKPSIRLPSQLIKFPFRPAHRTQEELSHRLDHLYRRVQGGPFPPPTGIFRSCAPLPPSVVPTTSAPSATAATASAIRILLHSPSLHVLYVDQIRPSDHLSPNQTFTYGFPIQQCGHIAKPRWDRATEGSEWHCASERQPLDRHTRARQR